MQRYMSDLNLLSYTSLYQSSFVGAWYLFLGWPTFLPLWSSSKKVPCSHRPSVTKCHISKMEVSLFDMTLYATYILRRVDDVRYFIFPPQYNLNCGMIGWLLPALYCPAVNCSSFQYQHVNAPPGRGAVIGQVL